MLNPTVTPLPNLDSEYPAGRRAVKKEPHKDLPDLRKTPAKFTFSKQAISHLSLVDQILFERFGQGPIVSPTHEIIHHGFEEYAKAQPQAIAVQHLGEIDHLRRLGSSSQSFGSPPFAAWCRHGR